MVRHFERTCAPSFWTHRPGPHHAHRIELGSRVRRTYTFRALDPPTRTLCSPFLANLTWMVRGKLRQKVATSGPGRVEGLPDKDPWPAPMGADSAMKGATAPAARQPSLEGSGLTRSHHEHYCMSPLLNGMLWLVGPSSLLPGEVSPERGIESPLMRNYLHRGAA